MNKKELLMYRGIILLLSLAVVALCWSWYHSGTYTNTNTCCVENETVCCKSNPTFSIMDTIAETIALPEPCNMKNVSLKQSLDERQTIRNFKKDPLSDQQIATLLWCALGKNREDGKRTAPTARNAQEIDLYLFTPKAIYCYDASSHSLKLVKEGDYRKNAGKQAFYEVAPIAISIVADFDKMANFDDEGKMFYSATDAGYVSQNIYLFSSAAKLATVACGQVERDSLLQVLELKNAKPILSHPIAYSAEE